MKEKEENVEEKTKKETYKIKLRILAVISMVQSVALRVINENSNFKDQAMSDQVIKKYLTKNELSEMFNPYTYLSNVDKIYKRFGL